MFTITRRFIALVALVLVTSSLVGCGGKSPLNPSENPVTPPAGGVTAWSTGSAACSVTRPNPLPANMGDSWGAEVMGHINQAGLSYTSKWYFRDEAGNETVASEPPSGVTQNAGVDAYLSTGGGFAPKKPGNYTLVGRYTETRGSDSNTLTSTCSFPVK